MATSPARLQIANTTTTPPFRDRGYVPNSRSSDSLPSPSKLLQINVSSRLKSGSRAAAIPNDKPSTFQSTSRLLQFGLLDSKHAVREDSPKKEPAKKKRQSKAEGTDTTASTAALPKTKRAPKAAKEAKNPRKRKSESDAAADDGIIEADSAVTKPKIKRARKSKDAEPATEPKKVTARKKTSKSSSHFSPQAKQNDDPSNDTVKLGLAIKRRTDWTPPKPVETATNVVESIAIYSVPSSPAKGVPSPSKSRGSPPKPNFATLQKDFAYDAGSTKSASTSPTKIAAATTVLNAGRRVEMIPGPAIHPPEPVMKSVTTEASKVSPKKYKSITERVVDRYRRPEEQTCEANEPQVASIFQPQAKVAGEGKEAHMAAAPAKPRKARRKAGDTKDKPATKAKAKAKAAAPVKPKFISPKTHAARMQRQDILFATSSQLRMDEAPSHIREIHEALQVSTKLIADPEPSSTLNVRLGITNVKRRIGGKLWGEGAQREDIDGFAALSDALQEPLAPVELPAVIENEPTEIVDSFIDISAILPQDPPAVEQQQSELPRSTQGGFLMAPSSPTPPSHQPALISAFHRPNLIELTSPTRIALRALSTNTKSPTKRSPSKSRKSSKAAAEEKVEKRPRGRPRKDAANPKAQSSPPRPRGRPPKTAVSASSPPTTPRRRGRPPKVRPLDDIALAMTPTKGSVQPDDDGFQDIDEIEDSEPDCTPTPRKRGRPSSKSPPPSLPLTITAESEAVNKRVNTAVLNALHPRWPAVQAKLFPEITSIVKSAPPSNDIKNLSWNEKILLYDPIVLEDLTAWINEQGMRVESKDKELVEVSAWMVQSWCERNSICCLWREGLRGGVRVRY